MPPIRTRNLCIVPLGLQDADAILHGRTPMGANWAPGYPADATLVAAGIVATAASEGRDLGPWTAYQVKREPDGRVIAGMGFFGPPDADGVVHVGFSETDEARADELAIEALAALAAFAVAQPDVTAVHADTAVTNRRAVAVFEAAGLRRQAVDAGLAYYAYP